MCSAGCLYYTVIIGGKGGAKKFWGKVQTETIRAGMEAKPFLEEKEERAASIDQSSWPDGDGNLQICELNFESSRDLAQWTCFR